MPISLTASRSSSKVRAASRVANTSRPDRRWSMVAQCDGPPPIVTPWRTSRRRCRRGRANAFGDDHRWRRQDELEAVLDLALGVEQQHILGAGAHVDSQNLHDGRSQIRYGLSVVGDISLQSRPMASLAAAALTLVAAGAAWGGLGWLLTNVPPSRPLAILAAYVFAFAAITSTGAAAGLDRAAAQARGWPAALAGRVPGAFDAAGDAGAVRGLAADPAHADADCRGTADRAVRISRVGGSVRHARLGRAARAAVTRARNPFDTFARLYDWEHDRYLLDVDVHLGFARRFGGPVLELACGTGRLLGPLAQAGFAVTGVDSSPAMLERARQRLERLGTHGDAGRAAPGAPGARRSLPHDCARPRQLRAAGRTRRSAARACAPRKPTPPTTAD